MGKQADAELILNAISFLGRRIKSSIETAMCL